MERLVEIRDLSVVFGSGPEMVTAVRGAGFYVDRGETVVLAGESGSGKTLTALSITRVLPQGARIASGSIVFCGRDLLSLPEREMVQIRGGEVSYIFQEPTSYLNPVYTIQSQIAEVLALHQGM